MLSFTQFIGLKAKWTVWANKCALFMFLCDKGLKWKITVFFVREDKFCLHFCFPVFCFKRVTLNWKQLYLTIVAGVLSWVIQPLGASNLYMHFFFLKTLYYCPFIALRAVCVLAAVFYAMSIQMKHQDILPLPVLY